MTHGPNATPQDTGLSALNGQPSGVFEAFHTAQGVFSEAITSILNCVDGAEREHIEMAINRIIAGTAIYAYAIGSENKSGSSHPNDERARSFDNSAGMEAMK